MSRNQSSNRQHACQTKYNDITANSSPHLELLREPELELERRTLETLPIYPPDGSLYKQLYEHIPTVYITLDLRGKILTVNRFGAQVLGFSLEQLLQKDIQRIFASWEFSRITDMLTKISEFSPLETAEGEFQLDCPNPDIAWVRMTVRKLTMPESEPIILMVCEDITEQKRSEDVLRESEQRFHTIAEIAPVMLWTAGADGFFNFFNQYWLEFTGVDCEEATGYGWLNLVHPEERLHCLQSYHAAFSARQQFAIEYRLLRHDGEYRWILDTGVPRFSPAGLFSGYIGCGIDISDRKLAEIALTQSQSAVKAQIEEMERLDRLKDEFLSTVSHELRTPLTNMKMAIQMLGISLKVESNPVHGGINDRDVAKTKRYLHILNNECDREINLINNFLDLQKLDSNTKSLILETINIPSWLNRVVHVFQTRHHRFTQPIHLRIPENLPLFTCDPFSLERILIELLTNACKFSPTHAEIEVKVESVEQTVKFAVTNTGTEIPSSEIPRIFDKFYRIPSNDPWKQGGTGLGLALVKKLTKYMGGDTEVVSGSNITCFTVSFPLGCSI
ncbi:sensor histidine kinase [Calothrix sp. NIES-3974]|uniref:sensor histidine kinase n=1 Tax=Calothrix sp. NIES-3974 TaxID=2005462 RepID=UPI000B5F8B50|nr:PAS domain-containing sensor histidine kinase [Calothrix sp. NIES-3974]BAZ04500.1 two-component sensor histidine kinase [Calothrix sp. NIES-3974]